jgi:hypothetical protein
MFGSALDTEIRAAAQRYNLPHLLLEAMVMTESDGNSGVWRYEPRYRYLVDVETGSPFRPLTAAENASEQAPADFPHPRHSSRDTEWVGQQASWGPLQVMGAVARELGFRHPFPLLCTAGYGIEYGAKHLHLLRLRFLKKYGWMGVVAAYNAGAPRYDAIGKFQNQAYVDSVARQGGFQFDERDYE